MTNNPNFNQHWQSTFNNAANNTQSLTVSEKPDTYKFIEDIKVEFDSFSDDEKQALVNSLLNKFQLLKDIENNSGYSDMKDFIEKVLFHAAEFKHIDFKHYTKTENLLNQCLNKWERLTKIALLSQ